MIDPGMAPIAAVPAPAVPAPAAPDPPPPRQDDVQPTPPSPNGSSISPASQEECLATRPTRLRVLHGTPAEEAMATPVDLPRESPPAAEAAPAGDPSGSEALRRLELELAAARDEVNALHQMLEDLPEIFERKFRQRLQTVLDHQQHLLADNQALRERLYALPPAAEPAATGKPALPPALPAALPKGMATSPRRQGIRQAIRRALNLGRSGERSD